MKSKSEQTKEFILEKVAPIFNSKGFKATSLSDLIYATKLSKGSIYGNFDSKEDLAIKAFKYNVDLILKPLRTQLEKCTNAIDKLFTLTNFYRDYYDFVLNKGGCPVLNVASDTNNVNTKLFQVVKEVAKDLENRLSLIIQDGVDKNEIKKGVNSKIVAKNIYSMIEGSIFMAFVHNDKVYITEMMNHVDTLIKEQLMN
ncbi:TetR/AcrR family transcriptional regulator [Urechidicola croceus]|uniref:HTH tetR-type domain-containing protein n=1 Tax=Urechidicola croceus TaxID=1850246 RepID=A0A1D8PA93_9FLAO|nr:TetR/AcrR family transcriptional regulator [Urechidicola croceus]AOW21497.1 hypothetical protein LPB138_12765 [Urechidicola croceus]